MNISAIVDAISVPFNPAFINISPFLRRLNRAAFLVLLCTLPSKRRSKYLMRITLVPAGSYIVAGKNRHRAGNSHVTNQESARNIKAGRSDSLVCPGLSPGTRYKQDLSEI